MAARRSCTAGRGKLYRLRAIIYIPALPGSSWTIAGEQAPRFRRKARPLERRPEAARRGGQAQAGEGRHPARARRLGRSAWRLARQGGDGAGLHRRARQRLQHQRRDHHARFGERAHLRVVHARRRNGPSRDDGLAQSHRRSRSCDLSRAAVGAGRRLGAVRRIFRQRRAVSFLAAAAPAQGAQAARRPWPRLRRRPGDRVVPAARRGGSARASGTSEFPACAAGRSAPARPSRAFPTIPNPTWT